MGSDCCSSSPNQNKLVWWNPCTNLVRARPHKLPTRKKSHRMIDDLDNVDFISSRVHSSRQEALLYVFEQDDHKGKKPYNETCFQNPQSCSWIGCLTESTWTPRFKSNTLTPKSQLADVLTKGNFTRDEWNHLLCFFNISHLSSISSLKSTSKRTQEDASGERVTAKSKPMMNLVSRYSARDPNVLADCIRKPGENKIWRVKYLWAREMSSNQEQGDLWLAPAHQTTQNGTLTKSGLLKSGNLVKCWKQVRGPVSNKLVIDIDMDSDTATESNLLLKSRSFLHKVNDRLRKVLGHSSKDATQDIDKRSFIWWMFMSSTLEASVVHEKEQLRKLTFHQKYRWTISLWSRCSR